MISAEVLFVVLGVGQFISQRGDEWRKVVRQSIPYDVMINLKIRMHQTVPHSDNLWPRNIC